MIVQPYDADADEPRSVRFSLPSSSVRGAQRFHLSFISLLSYNGVH